jgi:hypothetical protein
MANDIYEANGVDLKIKRNENKDIDDKEIDIIMDLFEQKGCQIQLHSVFTQLEQ